MDKASFLFSTIVAAAALFLPCGAPAEERWEAGSPVSLDLGGDVFLDMAWIPDGEFIMGSLKGDRDERPPRRVVITKGFWISRREITQAQWERLMGGNPSRFAEGGKDAPVEMVSWDDAQSFLLRLTRMFPGRVFRLPSEAEWEYACRAGSDGEYYTGEREADLLRAAWTKRNSGGSPRITAWKMPNAFGLYDMLGNLWEWCEDYYDSGYYKQGPSSDPPGPSSGKARAIRGGAWTRPEEDCRAASRHDLPPGARNHDVGFRVVMAAQ